MEVVLLGQNVNSYGKNRKGDPFPNFCGRIFRDRAITRIRSSHRHREGPGDRTIRLFEEIETLCPHVHLPLQAGSDRVLKPWDGLHAREYLAKIAALRHVRPGMAFSFRLHRRLPGETESDFRRDPFRQ